MRVGVLAVQGAVREHLSILSQLGIDGRRVKKVGELSGLSGLILPGGESTTISLLSRGHLLTKVGELVGKGFPVFGTCAGMILLAGEIEGQEDAYVQAIDITVARNASGRQVDSFETMLCVKGVADDFPAVFIRAPYITRIGNGVTVLAKHEGAAVMARQGNVLVASFHPELTSDMRIHRYFIGMVKEYEEKEAVL